MAGSIILERRKNYVARGTSEACHKRAKMENYTHSELKISPRPHIAGIRAPPLPHYAMLFGKVVGILAQFENRGKQ